MKTLLIIIASLTILSGCKKYDDGPALTLRTPQGRLTQEWNVYRYQMNLADVIGWPAGSIEFKSNGDYNAWVPGLSVQTGKWQFTKDRNQILVTGQLNGITLHDVLIIEELSKDNLHFYVDSYSGSTKPLRRDFFCEPK